MCLPLKPRITFLPLLILVAPKETDSVTKIESGTRLGEFFVKWKGEEEGSADSR